MIVLTKEEYLERMSKYACGHCEDLTPNRCDICYEHYKEEITKMMEEVGKNMIKSRCSGCGPCSD